MGNTFKKFKSLLLSIFCFTAVAAADNDYLPLDEIGIGDFEFSEEEVNQIDMMSKEKYSSRLLSKFLYSGNSFPKILLINSIFL